MIETDVLYAYVKASDWLKSVAEGVIKKIGEGVFGLVYVSREALHEIYYVSKEEGVGMDELIRRVAVVTAIDNLVFLDTTYEIDLLTLTLVKQYGLPSIFDAYYAATALNQVPDHTIVSTDGVFDQVPGIRRVDPRGL